MNLLIESIEGGTYLASIIDGRDKYYIYDESNKPRAFHCLNEIKSHLSTDTFEQVWLIQQTPYEEMCGMEQPDTPLELHIDWH